VRGPPARREHAQWWAGHVHPLGAQASSQRGAGGAGLWQSPWGPGLFCPISKRSLERLAAWDSLDSAGANLALLHGEHRPCPQRTMLKSACTVAGIRDEAELRSQTQIVWSSNANYDQQIRTDHRNRPSQARSLRLLLPWPIPSPTAASPHLGTKDGDRSTSRSCPSQALCQAAWLEARIIGHHDFDDGALVDDKVIRPVLARRQKRCGSRSPASSSSAPNGQGNHYTGEHYKDLKETRHCQGQRVSRGG